MDITSAGTVVLRTPETEPNIVIGRFDADVNVGTVARRLRLPADALQPGDRPFVIRSGPTRGDLLVERGRDVDDDVVVVRRPRDDVDIDRDELSAIGTTGRSSKARSSRCRHSSRTPR